MKPAQSPAASFVLGLVSWILFVALGVWVLLKWFEPCTEGIC